MESATVQARRANIEDLDSLMALWQATGLPGLELEKYLTEFQLAIDESGTLCGAIGLLTAGQEGLLHSEAVAPEASPDDVRQALWNRLHIVARNQGINRIWTQEDAPYWIASGFQPATKEEVAAMPPAFADPDAKWFVHGIADTAKANRLVAEQLAIWDATRQQERDALTERIANIRTVALIVVAGIAGVILLMMVFVLVRRPDIVGRLFGP